MKLFVTATFLAITALAQDSSDRSKLIGQWQSEAGANSPESWKIETEGDTMHITQFRSGTKTAEIACNTMGRECEGTDEGHRAKVSMYYNGPKLVQLETKGDEVVKRRFSIAGDGGLEIELIPISPQGKTETAKFKRVELSSARQ
jgi:hypothetical protein